MARHLTDHEVHDLRLRYADGVPVEELAALSGRGESSVLAIVRGYKYAEAPGPVTPGRHYVRRDVDALAFLEIARDILLEAREVQENGCWYWPGAPGASGYASIQLGPFQGQVHRLSYQVFVGEIPEGMVIDHRCHSESTCAGGASDPCRRCYAPTHLRVLSPAENTRSGRTGQHFRRRTHCPQGHPYDDFNTMWGLKRGRPYRRCRECNRAFNRYGTVKVAC